MKKILLLMVCLAVVAGCSRAKPKIDPAIAACPERTLRMLQDNQRYFETLEKGEQPVESLRKVKGFVREATLVKLNEEPMKVLFYQTGLPTCAWLVYKEVYTPVVIRDRTIVAVGSEQVKELTAHGWALQEAAWPWQRYDFGYIPPK